MHGLNVYTILNNNNNVIVINTLKHTQKKYVMLRMQGRFLQGLD